MLDPRNIEEDKMYAIEGRDMKRVAAVMIRLHGIHGVDASEQWDLAKKLEAIFNNAIEMEID